MAAYYNENDLKIAAWLKELIKQGLITDGEVDTRSIVEVAPSDLVGFVQCHFFAGIGGWSYALRLAGWPDDRECWTGSCPCQPWSSAGTQAGGNDPRDLWPAWFQLIAECHPLVVFGEQVEAAIGHGWLDRLCDDLEGEGYAVGPCGLPSACVGAFDKRQRLWFVADGIGARFGGANRSQSAWIRDAVERRGESGELGDTKDRDGWSEQQKERARRRRAGSSGAGEASFWSDADWIPCRDGKWRPVPSTQPEILALADGFWYRMADVRAAFAAEGAEAVRRYAATAGSRSEETMSVVLEAVRAQAIQWAVAGQVGVSSSEILLAYLRDVASALNRGSDSGSGEEEGAETDRRVLRDLRLAVSAECASLRREPEEQRQDEFTDALCELSRFLARCSEASGSLAGRAYATDFPLTGKIAGRVGILRGAGNAINPWVAKEFIGAYMDICDEV